MFKVKIGVDVIRGNSSTSSTFETMVDNKTWSDLSSTGSRDSILASWCNTFFPGADSIKLMQKQKI
jgi:hypothetical protein